MAEEGGSGGRRREWRKKAGITKEGGDDVEGREYRKKGGNSGNRRELCMPRWGTIDYEKGVRSGIFRGMTEIGGNDVLSAAGASSFSAHPHPSFPRRRESTVPTVARMWIPACAGIVDARSGTFDHENGRVFGYLQRKDS